MNNKTKEQLQLLTKEQLIEEIAYHSDRANVLQKYSDSLLKIISTKESKEAIVLLDKTYEGFESFYDFFRDTSEVFDFPEDPRAKNIPGEFMGEVMTLVVYIPDEDENIK